MQKYLYNNSDLYTLLFKGGSVEIKAKKAIPVTLLELELPQYQLAIQSGQITVYDTLAEIPQELNVLPEMETVSRIPTVDGLSEAELIAQLEAKGGYKVPGKVTTLGVKEDVVVPPEPELVEVKNDEIPDPVLTVAEVAAPVSIVVEPVTENRPTRGRKSKTDNAEPLPSEVEVTPITPASDASAA